jgi:hypothetical protein
VVRKHTGACKIIFPILLPLLFLNHSKFRISPVSVHFIGYF